MVAYPHFGIPNLYLLNGYKEIETSHGPALQIDDEEAMEHCVRLIVLRKPNRLHGRELRFLRRGLNLSQTEFGDLVERDAQTIARWEKSAEPVSQIVDTVVRLRFAQRFDPSLTTDQLCRFIDGRGHPFPEKVILIHQGADWSFNKFESQNPVVYSANNVVYGELPASLISSRTIFRRISENHHIVEIPMLETSKHASLMTEFGQVTAITSRKPETPIVVALTSTGAMAIYPAGMNEIYSAEYPMKSTEARSIDITTTETPLHGYH